MNIWIEAENINGPRVFEDENTDVIVEMETGEKYIATFFTYKNIETLRKKNIQTGECFSGKYFSASDMLIVDECSRKNIENIISYLIQEQEFEFIFRKLDE